MSSGPRRQRDVTQDDPGRLLDSPASRVGVDRPQARLLFAQAEAKARETIGILDELAGDFRLDIQGASDHVRSLVRLLDPDSGGNYISWETYKRCVDMEIATAYPDLLEFESGRTHDPLMDHERLKALFIEQSMSVD